MTQATKSKSGKREQAWKELARYRQPLRRIARYGPDGKADSILLLACIQAVLAEIEYQERK